MGIGSILPEGTSVCLAGLEETQADGSGTRERGLAPDEPVFGARSLAGDGDILAGLCFEVAAVVPVEGDVAEGAVKADVLAKLTPEQKSDYDTYVKYVINQDFGERENQLKAMLPKLAQAGVEIGGLVAMAKQNPDFAKLAGIAMATQVRNVGKDADALKKILDDTTKAKDFWAALDAEDKEVQRQTKEAEAEVAK